MARPTNSLWLWPPWPCWLSDEVKSFKACIAAALPREEVEAGFEWGVGDEEEEKKLWWDLIASGCG